MRKIFLVLFGVLFVTGVMHAQTLQQDQAAVVYYSPKTIVVLDFTYTVETQEMGIYAKYAEEMLGLDDVVKENVTNYTLEDVSIRRRTEVDLSRPHTIIAEKGLPLQYLSINDRGLLMGYNLPQVPKAQKNESHFQPERPKKGVIHVAPIPEEVMEAATPLAQAHALAKQIFRIRETRMYLLSGEVEHAPADGEAMKQVLTALDKQEKQLLALFVGKKTTRKEHKKIEFCPSKEATNGYTENLFFSAENGFTNAENIDAERIIVRAEYRKQEVKAAPVETKKKKNAVELSQLSYTIPGYAQIKVDYQGQELASRLLPVAQLGADMQLAKDLFTGATLPVIVINEKTGNIVSITR